MKLLVVNWGVGESYRYYIDKDRYSRAHEREDEYILDAYEGTYHFNKATKKVTLDTGVVVRTVAVKDWYFDDDAWRYVQWAE